MNTWNKFLRAGIGLLAMLLVVTFSASNASASSYDTVLKMQTFSSWPPSGWTVGSSWSQTSPGPGSTTNAALLNLWTGAGGITSPAENVSAFASSADSVWVDFDFFWQYNYYCSTESLDTWTVEANSTSLLSGSEAAYYTFFSDASSGVGVNYAVTQSSSSDWVHYHMLIPVAQRTSSMTITWTGSEGWGCSDPAIANVTITAWPPPPVPELSLQTTPPVTPKVMNFGTATPSSAVTLLATVKSVGSNPLTITGASISGSSAYTIVSGPANGTILAVGGTAQYGIQFLPLSSGTLTGTFTLVTNGTDSGTQSISLTGIGSVPGVSYNGVTALFHGVNIELGDTSGVQYIPVTSDGIGALNFTNIYFIGLNSTNYFITRVPKPSLASGVTDSIGIKFAPTVEGRPDATLIINSTAANQPLDTILLYGDGILPHLSITLPSPSVGNTLNFGSVAIGDSVCQTMTLTNPGSDTLLLLRQLLTYGDYDFSFYPLTGTDTIILPGASKLVNVCFKPLDRGTREASLRFFTNIPLTFTTPRKDTSQFPINVTGIGVASGQLAITGPAVNDSVAVGTQQCMVDTLWNIGQASVTVTSASITGADSAEFEYSGLTFPFTLIAGASQTFQLCAKPTSQGSQTAMLTANGTTNETPISASYPLGIIGTNVCDTIAWVTNFPASTCMGSVDTAAITVTNCGNVPAVYSATISGTNANQFAIVGSSTSSSEGSGGVATFMVSYTPDATDATSTAVFNITGGAGGMVTLNAARSSATIAGSATAPITAVGATSAPFPVPVTNSGECEWNPGTGITAGPFTYVSGSAPIPPGGNINLMFTFNPTVAGMVTQPVLFPNQTGTSLPAPDVTITGTAGSASVAMVSAQNGYSIDQSYPNPSTGMSNVEITLPSSGLVHLAILDVTGQVVETVLDRQFDEGTFSVTIDAKDLASGTYFYQMTSGGVTLTRQMTIAK